jgi:hypothetical protein
MNQQQKHNKLKAQKILVKSKQRTFKVVFFSHALAFSRDYFFNFKFL